MGQIQLERDFVDLLSFFLKGYHYISIDVDALMEYYPYTNIRILYTV